jgi:hypothetical protein
MMKIPNSLRLSLRDLFWLILVVGMGLGWYLEYRFAAPMRAGYRYLEPDIGKHEMEAVATSGEYRGVYFEVKAMTREYREQPDEPVGPPGAVYTKEFQSPPEPEAAD